MPLPSECREALLIAAESGCSLKEAAYRAGVECVDLCLHICKMKIDEIAHGAPPTPSILRRAAALLGEYPLRHSARQTLTAMLSIFRSGRWTQKEMARTIDGTPTCPFSSDAHFFCLAGALHHCSRRFTRPYYPERYHIFDRVRLLLLRETDSAHLVQWNDDPARRIDEVIFVCEEALSNT